MKNVARRPLLLALGAVMLLCSLMAGALIATPGPAAAHGEPHPAHIHTGDCSTPGGVTAPLDALGYSGEETALAWSQSTVELTLDALLAEPHAIVVHESAENIGNYILCGDITGLVTAGALAVPLTELNDSGHVGVALLSEAAEGTEVLAVLIPGPTGDAVTATIQRFIYRPNPIEIKAGTTVTWTNNDGGAHTVTADNGAFDSGQMAGGGTFSFTFTAPGEYTYFCIYHANMTGKVVVTE